MKEIANKYWGSVRAKYCLIWMGQEMFAQNFSKKCHFFQFQKIFFKIVIYLLNKISSDILSPQQSTQPGKNLFKSKVQTLVGCDEPWSVQSLGDRRSPLAAELRRKSSGWSPASSGRRRDSAKFCGDCRRQQRLPRTSALKEEINKFSFFRGSNQAEVEGTFWNFYGHP